MKLLKKDWLFDAKITGLIVLGILSYVAALIFVFVKVLNKMPVENGMEIYNKIYFIMALGVAFYPMFAFKAVCPQMGSDKLYMSTANLPMSRKEVFFRGLKPWLIIFPIVLIGGGLGSVALSIGTGNLGEILFTAAFTPILTICFVAIIQLQTMAGCIFKLAKALKGYKVIEAIVLFDFVLILICSISIRVFKINTAHNPWWMIGCGALILSASLIMFLIAWKDIERVYQ